MVTYNDLKGETKKYINTLSTFLITYIIGTSIGKFILSNYANKEEFFLSVSTFFSYLTLENAKKLLLLVTYENFYWLLSFISLENLNSLLTYITYDNLKFVITNPTDVLCSSYVELMKLVLLVKIKLD